MKRKSCMLLIFIAMAVTSTLSFAQNNYKDLQTALRNDKEVNINAFKKEERERIENKYNDPIFKEQLTEMFFATMRDFLNEESNLCEFNFIKRFHDELVNTGLAADRVSVEEYFKLLRATHAIDDLLYEILISINNDYTGMNKLDLSKGSSTLFWKRTELFKHNNLSDLFLNFNKWPDESSICSNQEYIYIKNNIWISNEKKSERTGDLKALIIKAYDEKVIDLETYHKLEYFRKESDINKRNLWLKDYLKTILNVKNKLTPLTKTYEGQDIENEDPYASERVERFSSLTRRKILYQKYDATQIMMLAQVLQRASQRMGVDPDTDTSSAVILMEFNILQPNGERRNYVERIELDPQSQYNLARRLLRKDILDLQMMDTFNKLTISYTDVVVAAYETGYITHEDLEFVVKYDDLWNPEMTRWEKISNFVFNVAGYSSFFIPPPWSVVTSIVLTVVEGVVEDKFFKNGAQNDNPATFIE